MYTYISTKKSTSKHQQNLNVKKILIALTLINII